MKWQLQGFDTFSGESYTFPREYKTRKAAVWLIKLEGPQPIAQSGGQADDGIQDQIFIVRPDGTAYRYEGPRNM